MSAHVFAAICASLIVFNGGSASAAGPSNGADVIVGELQVLETAKPGPKGRSGLWVTTVSCNAGRAPIPWVALPNPNHPAITVNLYALSDGRLKQIGQSGVKHGFSALQQVGVCPWTCDAFKNDEALGPGCADPYWGPLVERTDTIGPRSKINPATGVFDGNKAASQEPGPLGRMLQVKNEDLTANSPRLFAEAQYISAQDIKDGNGLNNVAYREIEMGGTPAKRQFKNKGDTTRGCPAIAAWDGAKLTAKDVTGYGRLIVGTYSTKIADGRYRVDIGVYNMNSDRAVRAVSVPLHGLTVVADSLGFAAPFSHGENWSNAPWKKNVS